MFFSHNNLEGFILVLLSANIQKRRLADGGFHDVLSLIVGFACYKTFFTTNSDTQTAAGACEKAYFPLVNISTFHQWNSYKRRFNGLVYQIAINYNKKKPLMRVTKKEAKVDRKPWKLLNCGDAVLSRGKLWEEKKFSKNFHASTALNKLLNIN